MTAARNSAGMAPPPPGEPVAVAPGVLWLRMTLPFALDHINLWLLEDGAGWAAVDSGIDTPATRAHWETVLHHPLLEGRGLTRIVCTHFHPDHMGLAGWLTDRFAAPLWTTLGEWATGLMLSLDTGEAHVRAQEDFYRRAGFPAEMLERVRRRGNVYARAVSPLPRAYRRIHDGETLRIGGRDWRAITGQGHAPELVTLHDMAGGLLISGDQVLERISPNVSVWPNEPEADPLALFLASLDRFAALPANTLVLPSHGRPFVGLRERVAALKAHHAERLEATRAACGGAGASAFALVPHLFERPLDEHQLFFAVGEVLAHLRRLEALGAVERTERDGVDAYRTPRA